ncbi:leucine aminopeptidase-like [Pyrus communis]|uniref:leucine aminopeptidase-like n=1 Tax=Pyrus communis TaxID=23211 RepID=UPI0035C12172
MAPIDPHSLTDSTHPFATHISLSFFFDFPSSTIHASALLTLPASYSGPLSLDIRALTVHSVIDPHKPSRHLSYVISHPDPIKGCHLTFTLSNAASVLILYSTSPSSSALQWLSPPQQSR